MSTISLDAGLAKDLNSIEELEVYLYICLYFSFVVIFVFVFLLSFLRLYIFQ